MSNRGYRPPSRPSSAGGYPNGNGNGYGRRESNRPPNSPGAFYQQQGQYRGSSPALDYGNGNGNGGGGGGYPELQYGEAPASIGPQPSEVDYDERDLGEISNQNQARQEKEWRHGPEAGVPYNENPNYLYYSNSNEWGQQQHQHSNQVHYSTAPPPRSSYSSPPPRNSLEVGSVYGFYSEPPQPSAEYYYGAPIPGPASIASSGRTLGSGPGPGRFPCRPSSQPLSSPYSTRDEQPPRFFDVNAPHHSPGNRRSLPLGTGGSRDTHPYVNGGEGNDMYGDNLPAFPSWSRTWYGGHLSADGHAYTQVPPPSGGQSGWESETLTQSGGAGGHRGYHYGRTPGEEGITDYVKEERMKMLEKEFGPKIKHNGKGEGEDDEEVEQEEEEELVMGSVDKNGRLVTPRPKTRKTIRWCQGLISLVAVCCGIGGALLIKPTGKDIAAASGTMPAYVLYAVSVVALLITLYLFVFRPCCCDPIKRHDKGGAGGVNNPMAGMVIPVLGNGNGGKQNKKFKKGKKGKGGMMMGGGTTVNLIVDPSMLGGKKEESSDEDDEDELLPGEGRKKKRKRKSKGLSMMENMKLVGRWQLARKFVKVVLVWDCILVLIWGAAAILTLAIGKSCPPGSSKGWCDLYNGNIACSVLSAVLGLIAIYFDAQDLKISKKSPRSST